MRISEVEDRMPLCRLIYFSENQIVAGKRSVLQELNTILASANRNNKSKNVTGALVFDEQWFLQVIEGSREIIWQMFQQICEDERHSGIVLSEFIEVESPIFGNWWMGAAMRSRETEGAFRPFLRKGIFDPRVLTAAQMLTLTIDLAKVGLHRDLVPCGRSMAAHHANA